jgi:hypothetical protein
MRSNSATAPARPSGATFTASAPVAPAQPTPQLTQVKPDASTNRESSGRLGSDARQPAQQKILFQKFFKSVGPRTYAAQVKEASNGNHFLVLTEGKRDDATGDVRKTRLFVFSEDFAQFFDLLEQTARFIKAHPVPDEVKQRRRRFWERERTEASPAAPAVKSK